MKQLVVIRRNCQWNPVGSASGTEIEAEHARGRFPSTSLDRANVNFPRVGESCPRDLKSVWLERHGPTIQLARGEVIFDYFIRRDTDDYHFPRTTPELYVVRDFANDWDSIGWAYGSPIYFRPQLSFVEAILPKHWVVCAGLGCPVVR